MAQSSLSVFQVLWMASIFFASLAVTAFSIKKPQMLDGSQMSGISGHQALQDNFEPDASEVNGTLNGLQTDVVQGYPLKIMKKHFTWAVSRKSRKLYHHSVDHELARVFKEYSKHTGVTFEQKPWYQDVDIEIEFGVQDHGCNYPFYGRGNVLAHAFLPYGDPLANIHMDVHFDDDESWSINKTTGTDFYPVALHEIGHVLGLEHTSIEESIMYPYYSEKYETLWPIDIANLKRLYAKVGGSQSTKGIINATNTTPTITTTKTTSTFTTIRSTTVDPIISTVCRGYFDTLGFYGGTMVITARQNAMMIPVESYTNEKPETFNSDRISISSISELWPKVSKYTHKINGIVDGNGKTYIFSDKRFWLVKGREMYDNFPIWGAYVSSIGLPSWANVVTAFKSSYDEKIYIFIPYEFYILDETKGKYGKVNKGGFTHIRWRRNVAPNAILSYPNGTDIFFERGSYTRYEGNQRIREQKYLSTNTHVIPGCN